MNVCGIKFKDTGKTYYFKNDGLNLKKNLTVVVDTDKGEQFAKVVELDIQDIKNMDIEQMKMVKRISTKSDYNRYLSNLKDGKEALAYAKNLAKEKHLDMRLFEASYTLDRKQLTFNFIADMRVDFRELVRDLAAKYKTRIELHQIGVRDRSREIGGIGTCGRELCCAKYMTCMETISINMAKNQGIALNPSRINGACGRLLCCLAYEDDVYSEHRQILPHIGEIITTKDGKGKVVSLDILNNKYTILIDGETQEYEVDTEK